MDLDTTAWVEAIEARVEERITPPQPRRPGALTVLFDPGCALCRRCREWMLEQPAYVALTFVECTGEFARAHYGDIPWLGDELVVVGDAGEVWAGPAAFLMCLWALVEWREWSLRLASPGLAPLAARFFRVISKRRAGLASFLERDCPDGTCRID
jgi:predicted DCC family thiol-disulfide oxidoreductase YuxK